VSFRLKLLLAMMILVSTITLLGVYFAQRQMAANVEQALKRQFQSDIVALHSAQVIRHAALAQLCRDLAQKPRIHAALEDNALDLLYPSAKDELRQIMNVDEPDSEKAEAYSLRATFYRFLDGNGAVIAPPRGSEAGELGAREESQLNLATVPNENQIGYLARATGTADETVDEVIPMPIISTETNEPIAAIVVGFKPVELSAGNSPAEITSGIWLKGRLHLPPRANPWPADITEKLTEAINGAAATERSFTIGTNEARRLLFYKELNPNSLFPPAYEVCTYPLNDLIARQRRVRWQIGGVGAIFLFGAFIASHFASARLSFPVRKLALDSAADRAQRERAEAALEKTNLELQRSARFSANTSHQLKTPVTVLRAGLEELRARKNLPHAVREEISALIHQTFRITSVIEDLLLLSQMDAGRLQINFSAIDLTHLLAAQLDDLSALPDGAEINVESQCPPTRVAGEQHYLALILQNLLENARKYNRPGGRIRISCQEEKEWACLRIGNTGQTIPLAAQEHIFERFHRGGMGENVSGHGLGLNLACELALLHGGELRLVRSGQDWTEFEVTFRPALPDENGAQAT
jgi:signal transduction histidine kinase